MRKLILISVLAPALAVAQLGSRPSTGSTSVATQLPLSGRTAATGSATKTQTPIPGATTSVNTINTTVQVSGPYAGSSPSILKTPFSGKLSFSEAIQRGLEYNLGTIGLATAVRQARGQATVSRSNLLPNLSGGFSQHYETPLWTCPRVAHLIEQEFGVRYHEGHVWKVLVSLGWSPQRPVGRARERNEEPIRTWKKKTWSAIKKKPAGKAARSSWSTQAD